MPPLYLDYNATTPLDPRVFEAMTPYFLEDFGNAGSRSHIYGQRAKEAVDAARKHVAAVLAVRPEEVTFTSGATESNNLALLGLVNYGLESGRRHVLSTAIEHKAVLEPLEQMQRLGFEVELAPITPGGYVEPETIARLLRPDTLVVSVMHANNETGVLQAIEEIGEIVAATETFFHSDAAQTFGKEVESLQKAKWDFVSVSGHKIYGPKGIGALGMRSRWSPAFRRQGSEKPAKAGTPARKRPLQPLLYGGGQERGLRPGTLPVPLIVGLGKAAELALAEHGARNRAAALVKQKLLDDLAGVPHTINGDPARAQRHVVNISFPGVDSEALMMAVRDEMAISNGSACTSAAYKASHVLTAMGLAEDLIESAIRISLGPIVRSVSAAELIGVVNALRPHSGHSENRVRAPLRPAAGRVPGAA